MDFHQFRNELASNFVKMASNNNILYEADVDKDYLWNLYLDSFPSGTNEIFRKRREYDCSCCRSFFRNIGGTVFIDDDLNVRSIFRFSASNIIFQQVIDKLSDYVESRPIIGKYLSTLSSVGTFVSREYDDVGKTVSSFDHFYLSLPDHMVYRNRYSKTINYERSQFRTTKEVFKRSLDDVSLDALDTVLELINSNTLYRGEEWRKQLSSFRKYKLEYDEIGNEQKDIYCWKKAEAVGDIVGRIRKHSIGVLLTDISEGMDLDAAVRRYESIVAPANYKRPKSIFTKNMLEAAQKTVEDLGYLDSLPRRFARIDDITINNVLFCNRDVSIETPKNIFDAMKTEVSTVSPKKFSKVQEIQIDKFVSDVLPNAREVEVLFENRHRNNLVSLIAPVNKNAPSMFKWNNNFGWAYNGNLADSDIRENVKKAGGNVTGDVRFSIQWNDGNTWDQNDLDAHCIEYLDEGEITNHIFWYNKRPSSTTGMLDVDIIQPHDGVPAVENIVYPDKNRMRYCNYEFCVNCYSNRRGVSGFRAEIEIEGKRYHYNYTKPLSQNETIRVATIRKKYGGYMIKHHIEEGEGSQEIWGIKTGSFVPVSMIMYSPNYWDNQNGIGNKHYMFMLTGCINPDKPNGFYNEYLKNELLEHKRVFEALGSRMSVEEDPEQLSGLGFSSTKRNEIVVRVVGATDRVMRVKF